MEFQQMLLQMSVLFIMIALGYFLRRVGLMDELFSKKLSALVINVTLPAMILGSLASSNLPDAGTIGTIVLVAFSCYALLLTGAFIVPVLMRTPADKLGVFRYMMTFGNGAFIGFPVVAAIFGQEGLFYATIFNFPFNFLVFTVGVTFIAPKDGARRFDIKTFLSPCVITSALTIILALLNVPIPKILAESFNLCGQVTTPAALLIVGSALAAMPARNLFGSVRLYILALLKLLIIPVLVWLCLRGFVTSHLLLGVSVIMTGMPVANNGTMLCYEYGGDQTTMSQGIFITTVLSVITIPILSQIPF